MRLVWWHTPHPPGMHEPSIHSGWSSVRWWSPVARASPIGSNQIWHLCDVRLLPIISEVLCQKQVSMARISNYIPQILWDVNFLSVPLIPPLAQHSSYTSKAHFTDKDYIYQHQDYGIHINVLVQERHNSIALAMELRLSCTNPSI